jgi:membrane protein implicated in regulation of membrane protease activity
VPPAFIPLILGVFLLAAKYKKAELIGCVVIANMINVLSMAYYPKLVAVYLPLSLAIVYMWNRWAKKKGFDTTPQRTTVRELSGED